MKSLFVALLLAVGFTAQANMADFEFSGTGSVTGPADQADVSFNVTTLAQTTKLSQAANARAKAAVAEALAAYGLKATDLKTVSYSTSALNDYDSNNKPVFKGQQTTHQLTVCVRNLDKVGDVVDAIGEVSKVSINGVTGSSSKAKAYQLQAYGLAYGEALAKAQAVAASANMTLGAVLKASEPSYTGGRNVYAASMRNESSDAGGTTITAGDLTFTATVNFVFDVK